jgi:hypothetical protein
MTVAAATGWSDEVILEMPMARLLAYEHAACWMDGSWTVPHAAQTTAMLPDEGALSGFFAARLKDGETDGDDWEDGE